MRLPDSIPQPITRLLRTGPVKFQRPVEQKTLAESTFSSLLCRS